jgi:hypothetical protein
MTIAGEDQGEQMLSQDARGHVLISHERRESLLEEYYRTGMANLEQLTLTFTWRVNKESREKERREQFLNCRPGCSARIGHLVSTENRQFVTTTKVASSLLIYRAWFLRRFSDRSRWFSHQT